MLLDKIPVDLDAKTRQVVQVEHAVAHGGSLGVQTVVDWITLGIPVRFCRKGTGAESGHDVGMQMGRAMGRDAYPVLLCQGGDAQCFGKTSVPRRIKLHEAQSARSDEIADGKAMPLPLA